MTLIAVTPAHAFAGIERALLRFGRFSVGGDRAKYPHPRQPQAASSSILLHRRTRFGAFGSEARVLVEGARVQQ